MPAVVAVLAVIEGADLSEHVLALLDQHLLDLGGTYGDPQAGELQSLTVNHAGGTRLRRRLAGGPSNRGSLSPYPLVERLFASASPGRAWCMMRCALISIGRSHHAGMNERRTQSRRRRVSLACVP